MKWWAGALLISSVVLGACFSRMVSMPGQTYAGPPAVADAALETSLRADVTQLATGFGERNVENAPAALEQTAAWLTTRLTGLGYQV